jgi:hypothetical protein
MIKACVICDARWGFGEYVEITMCKDCFDGYTPFYGRARKNHAWNDTIDAIEQVWKRTHYREPAKPKCIEKPTMYYLRSRPSKVRES